MKKKSVIYVLLSILIGFCIGKYIYNGYSMEAENVFKDSNKNSDVYLVQYGVYSNNDLMLQNTKKLKNYFYYVDDNKYHVLIGITKNIDLKEKIMNAQGIKDDVYMKKVNIDNVTFLESLNQYDNLVLNTSDKSTILTAEKQILSKYEELILRSE